MTLAVTAGKGGVGKSTVAYNLGAELDAVVVDADLAMADLPAARGPDLHDVLAGRADPIEAVREEGPVNLLPCGRSLAGARSVDPTALSATLSTLRREYGPVVVDCPAGMRADAGLPLLAAEACVIVTTPDRPALADAVRTRELARELDAGLAAVALNRDGGTGQERVREALGAPVTPIPESGALARAQATGVPVRSLAPDGPAADALAGLARTVQSCVSRV